MRIAHISDFHFTKLTLNPLRLLPKRIFGHIHWLKNRKKNFSKTSLEKLPDYLKKYDVDLLLLGGDFTSTAMPEEFVEASAWVRKFDQATIAIPGNHDCYTMRSQSQHLYYQYFKNKQPHQLSLMADGVEGHKISPKWWVIALDTTLPSLLDSSGLFSTRAEKNLLKLLSQIPEEEKAILFTHYPLFQQEGKKRGLRRHSELETIVKNHPTIALYLHGHTHRTSIADLRGNGYPIMIDSGSCSDLRSGSFHLIDLEDSHCKVTTHFWKEGWKSVTKQEFLWK